MGSIFTATKLGWTQIFMGYFTSGWQTCMADLEHK